MPDNRERIVSAATELLHEGGRAAVSTRAVCARAGVQSPTIYRLFGDMDGLLDAVAAHGFATYLAGKTARGSIADPVDELRAGWDQHIEFGLTYPDLYLLMYGEPPLGGPPPPAAVAGMEVLDERIRRIAEAGRLRVPQDRATALVHAAGSGTTLTLIATPPDQRDPDLSELAREAVIAAITADAPAGAASGPVAAAVALRARLSEVETLSPAEQALLADWLDRIARESSGPAPR